MPEPDFVARPGAGLQALLAFPHNQNPYPYPEYLGVLPSNISNSSESDKSIILKDQAKHSLENSWKYDPISLSVKAASQAARDIARNPYHGLTKKQEWWITTGKMTRVKKARSAPRIDFEKARKNIEVMKKLREEDNFKGTSIDQELDDYYGLHGTDIRPLDKDSYDEGFSEPYAITKTTISIPDNSLMEEGVTPGGIFQDSGISMDEGYAEYSLAHSLPDSRREVVGTVPRAWPSFSADVAPLRIPERKGRWLGLCGDQNQSAWPGRRQGPYDLYGLGPLMRGTKNHYEYLDEPEASNSDLQDMPESFTPEPVSREASISRQMVDDSSVEATHQTSLPNAVTLPTKSVERTQVSESMQGIMNGGPPEVTPRLFGQEQRSLVPGNNESEREMAGPERFNNTPDSSKDTGILGASIGAGLLVSEERPQHFSGSIKNSGNNESPVPAPQLAQEVPPTNTDANTYATAHASRSGPTAAFTTPTNQRIRQIQQVQIITPATPATPATVNINLAPEYTSDMDVDDASDDSLEVQLPSSPTVDAQKGQSALDRYVQETESYGKLARQSSSTVSLDGSESEQVSLVPTPQRPKQPEGHAGFSKGVELYQKESDAAFTLNPPKSSQEIPSSSKTAPIPATPAYGNDNASLHLTTPSTPFHFGEHANSHYDSPGTPTPAPKTSKTKKGTSVMNVFKSAKLASRSPQRASPSPGIVVAPFTPTAAGAADHQHPASPFGSQGLLFHKAKKNDKGTKNVLNSLKLGPERRAAGYLEREDAADGADERAGVASSDGGKGVPESPSTVITTPRVVRAPRAAARKKTATPAVVVPSVRPRDDGDDDGVRSEDVRSEEPRTKKLRRSTRTSAVVVAE